MLSVTTKITGNKRKFMQRIDPQWWLVALGAIKPVVLQQIGDEYIRRVREAMDTGNVQGVPLSESWIAQKGHSNPWVHNRILYDSMGVYKAASGGLVAGILPNVREPNGILTQNLGVMLETGSIKTPPRPVFGPIAQQFIAERGPIRRIAKRSIIKVL